MKKASAFKQVTVIIPCRNEEKGLKKMLASFDKTILKKKGLNVELIVVDNGSIDDTAGVANHHHVQVLYEPNIGKGNAIHRGFDHITNKTDYVVMLDGDATYLLEELPRMIEPLENNFCQVVVG